MLQSIATWHSWEVVTLKGFYRLQWGFGGRAYWSIFQREDIVMMRLEAHIHRVLHRLQNILQNNASTIYQVPSGHWELYRN